MNAQGEDVVSGVRTPIPINELEKMMPEVYHQLREITTRLEQHYKDVQDFEFTIQDGKLYMLQTRNGKRTGPAAVRIAVDMVKEGMLTAKDALLRVEPEQLNQLLHPVLDETKPLKVIAKGLPASPGAAVGRVVFTADDAVVKGKSSPVVLVRGETVPDDIHGMEVAVGILTSRGGMTSHAAVVTRGMGKPCVAGCGEVEVDEKSKTIKVGIAGDQGRRLDLARRFHRPRHSGQDGPGRARSAERRFRRVHEVGGQGQGIGRSRQCRHPARCPEGGGIWRRGHWPLPHRAHVLCQGTAAARSADDHGLQGDRRIPRKPRLRRRNGAPRWPSSCPCSARTFTGSSKP